LTGKRRTAAALLLCLSFSFPASASDDLQYWSNWMVKTHEWEPWSLSTYGIVRLDDDVSEATFSLISEQLDYQWRPWLGFGLNYSYISQELGPEGREEFKDQHRIEFDVSPRFQWDERFYIRNKNRFEWRAMEGRGTDNNRFRQRWDLVFPIKDALPVRSVYVGNEYFYDAAFHEINENRVIPFGIDFKLSERVGLKVFYMVQARKEGADWYSNQIVGTFVTIAL
jgi:hypothetical protein